MLLVLSDDALLVTDGRYRDQAADQVEASGAAVRIEIGRPAAQLAAVKRLADGVRRLGLEAEDVTWGAQQRLRAAISPGTELVSVSNAVEALRVVKDDGELARIERAADIADVALAQVKELLCEGPTEQEFATELDFEMRRRGAECVAFETIVASGPNSALPHARPTGRRVEPGELVVIDFGATVDGYRSDMTRTVCVGAPASGELQELLEAVLTAQSAGVRAVRPGVTGGDVDAACRDSLTSAGLTARRSCTGPVTGSASRSTRPRRSRRSPLISCRSAAVVTVEPGAYLARSSGGVRIEDTLVVTATGCRPLTKSTKDYTL